MKTSLLLIVGSLFIALLLVACGDEETKPAAEDGADTPAATAEVTKDAKGPAVSIASLEELKSFRFTIEMHIEMPDLEDEMLEGLAALFSDIDVTGMFVAPDKSQMKIALGVDGEEMEAIVVGDQTWLRFGEEWTESTEGAMDVELFSPVDLKSSIIDEGMLAVAVTSKEKMNGVDTVHYAVTETSPEQLTELFGAELQGAEMVEEMTIDLWLTADGGYPTRIVAEMAGKDEDGRDMRVELEMNIIDLNDPDIDVEPPEM